MTFLEGLSLVLVIGGGIVTFVSFANRDNITGLWVAGQIERDEEFHKAGRFKARVYWILRGVGILSFLAGLALMILLQ
jgi:hypothetical protein